MVNLKGAGNDLVANFGYTKIWAVCLIFPEFLAMFSTVFRLLHRYRKGLIWWDDIFALAALLVALPFFFWTYILLIDPPLSPSALVFLTWMSQLTFKTAEWATRISWTLSIARIVPPHNPIFRSLIGVAFVLASLWAGSIVSIVMMCTRNSSWRDSSPYLCPVTPAGAAFIFTAAIGADLALALIPLRMFWNVNLPNVAKRVVLIGFTAGSIVAPTAIFAVAAIMLPQKQSTPEGILDLYLFMHIGLICCFFGCNALVVFGWAFQLWYRNNAEVINQLTMISRTPDTTLTSLTSLSTPSTTSNTRNGLMNLRTGSSALAELALHFTEFSVDLALHSDSSREWPSESGSSIRRREVQ